MMLFENLKEATKQQHLLAEELNFSDQIMNHSLSFQAYEKLLLRNYLFHKHIEQHLSQLPNYDGKELSNLLFKDLELLNTPIISKTNTLELKNSDEILGSLYVKNGSLLGTKIIAAKIGKTKEITEKVPEFNYYDSGAQHINWKDTLIYIQTNYKDENDVIAGAKKAFDYFIELSKEI